MLKRPDRAEADRYFNWPYVAVEEALANAVYHKGYDVREPIEVRVVRVVRVDGDAMEIVSFPGPDRSVIGIKPPRTRQLLSQMVADGLIEAHGERRGRYYCLPKAQDAPC